MAVSRDSAFFSLLASITNAYKSSNVIRCKDGSGKFTKAQLNDDFCECADGIDELGFYFN